MKLTTIIPVHELDESTSELLKKSIESVVKQKKYDIKEFMTLTLVAPSTVLEEVKKIANEFEGALTIKYVVNDGNTNFQAQINKGVESCESDYFTILEFDDELSDTYFYNLVKHINYYSNVDVFLSVVIESNDSNAVLKFTNETSWSRSFVGQNGEIGFLNAQALNQYTDFKICGSTIKTKEFINAGMLKSNIVLTFQYEFLLRMINNGSRVYTIPKFGCKHFVTREGSLFDTYAKTLTLKERQFWFNVAKKESNFPSDREIDTSELLSVAE